MTYTEKAMKEELKEPELKVHEVKEPELKNILPKKRKKGT